MSFLSDLFGKGKKKRELDIPITKLPSSSSEKDGTEVRLPFDQQVPSEIKYTKPFEAKKIPFWKHGDVILEHYEIEEIITSGGMGRIYIANHRNWKVKIAIKSPTEEMLQDEDFYSRVVKEAEAWTELGLHPNIAYCYFVRNVEEVPHLFVEYVDGGNLRQWIEEGKCSDLKTGLDLAIQFCHGMAYAHSKGMIHRDIKPENILMTQDGTLKVTDFGIAKLEASEDTPSSASFGKIPPSPPLSKGGMGGFTDESKTIGFIGTKAYASPEQLEDAHNVGFETDIFSFGLCLWEMLCGVKPYTIAVEEVEIPDSRKLRPDLPEKLHILLEQLVAFEREERQKLGGFEGLRDRFKSIYHELYNEPSPHSELEKLDLESDGLNNKGVSYLELGKKEEAIKCFMEALQGTATHLQATYNLSLVDWRDGRIEDLDVLQRLKICKTYNLHNDMTIREMIDQIDAERLPQVKCILHYTHLFGLVEKGLLFPFGKYFLFKENKADTLKLYELPKDKSLPASFACGYDEMEWVHVKGANFNKSHNNLKFLISSIISISKCICELQLLSITSGWGAIKTEEIDEGYFLGPGSKIRKMSRIVKTLHKDQKSVKSAIITSDKKYVIFQIKPLTSGFKDNIEVWELNTSVEYRAPYVFCVPRSLEKIKDDNVRVKENLKRVEYLFQGNKYEEGLLLLLNIWRGIDFIEDNNIITLYKKFCSKGKKKSLLSIFKYKEYKTHPVRSIAITPDNKYIVSGSDDNTLRLWELDSGKCIRVFKGHNKCVNSVIITKDGRNVISASEDGTHRFWDIAAGKCLNAIQRHRSSLDNNSDNLKELENYIAAIRYSNAISPDGRYLISGEGEFNRGLMLLGDKKDKYHLSIWDIDSGNIIRNFKEHHEDSISTIAISPDGNYALSGSDDETIKLWDIETGLCLNKFKVGYAPRSIAISPDGRYAITGNAASLIDGVFLFHGVKRYCHFYIWDLDSGEEIKEKMKEPHEDSINSVFFCPDGTYAVSGSSDNTIKVWDFETGKCLSTLHGHKGSISSVVTTSDGNYIISGSSDNTIRVWRLIWDLEFPDPVDWDEGVRPYLEIFLTLHKGKWNEDDFNKLIDELASMRGYGWVRPEGIRRELEIMTLEYKK